MTELLIPLLFLAAAVTAMARRQETYAALLRGAQGGLRLLATLAPTLIVLLALVTMLRESGFFELLSAWLRPLFPRLGIPPELAPLVLIRPLSGSAALAVGTELMQRYGVDSLIGRTAAVMLGSSETTFYTISVYFGAAGIKKPKTGGATVKQRVYKGLRGAVNLMDKTHLFGSLPERGREALVQKFGSADYKALSPEMRKTFVKIISLDLTDELPRVKAPTLLYWGAEDTETPLWMGKLMEEKIPDAGLVVQKGAGHFAYLEHNQAFLRIAKNFLLEGRA